MRYLHTMLRVRDLDAAMEFYCKMLGMMEIRRRVDEKNRYTLVFLAGRRRKTGRTSKGSRPGGARRRCSSSPTTGIPKTMARPVFLATSPIEVDDIYATCERLMKAGVTINRPPRDGVMAFVRSPDKQSIELLQKGAAKPAQEPWKSMPNTGKW